VIVHANDVATASKIQPREIALQRGGLNEQFGTNVNCLKEKAKVVVSASRRILELARKTFHHSVTLRFAFPFQNRSTINDQISFRDILNNPEIIAVSLDSNNLTSFVRKFSISIANLFAVTATNKPRE